jgi:hypothetical protein
MFKRKKDINMNHSWKHPTHYKKVSDKRKKIHEEWIKDQEEKLRQIDAGQDAHPKGATKCRRAK